MVGAKAPDRSIASPVDDVLTVNERNNAADAGFIRKRHESIAVGLFIFVVGAFVFRGVILTPVKVINLAVLYWAAHQSLRFYDTVVVKLRDSKWVGWFISRALPFCFFAAVVYAVLSPTFYPLVFAGSCVVLKSAQLNVLLKRQDKDVKVLTPKTRSYFLSLLVLWVLFTVFAAFVAILQQNHFLEYIYPFSPTPAYKNATDALQTLPIPADNHEVLLIKKSLDEIVSNDLSLRVSAFFVFALATIGGIWYMVAKQLQFAAVMDNVAEMYRAIDKRLKGNAA